MPLKKKKKKSVVKRRPSKKKAVTKKKAIRKAVKRKPAKKAAKKIAALKKVKLGNVIGKVTHYFPHVQAAVIKLKAPLAVGDNVIPRCQGTKYNKSNFLRQRKNC